jgi:hypothetical protein
LGKSLATFTCYRGNRLEYNLPLALAIHLASMNEHDGQQITFRLGTCTTGHTENRRCCYGWSGGCCYGWQNGCCCRRCATTRHEAPFMPIPPQKDPLLGQNCMDIITDEICLLKNWGFVRVIKFLPPNKHSMVGARRCGPKRLP